MITNQPSVALWTLWNQLRKAGPKSVLEWIRDELKVTSVEIAGFACRPPSEMADAIKRTKMSVYSIHAPSGLLEQSPNTFADWCKAQQSRFSCSTVVVRTDDTRIRPTAKSYGSQIAYYSEFGFTPQ